MASVRDRWVNIALFVAAFLATALAWSGVSLRTLLSTWTH